MNILPGETACLACLFPKRPAGMVATCDTAGILNTAVNFAASVEVTEAIKFLVGARDKMRRTLLGRDLWTNDQAEVSAATPRARCTVCQLRDFTHLRGEDRPQITLCGRNSVQIHEHHRPVDFAEMQRRLEPLGKVNFNRLLLRFERGEYTGHGICRWAGAGARYDGRDPRPQPVCALHRELKKHACFPTPRTGTPISVSNTGQKNPYQKTQLIPMVQLGADSCPQATSHPYSASQIKAPKFK